MRNSDELPKKRGPAPRGEKALTPAERQAAYRRKKLEKTYDLTSIQTWDLATCISYLTDKRTRDTRNEAEVWVRWGVLNKFVTVSQSHIYLREAKRLITPLPTRKAGNS